MKFCHYFFLGLVMFWANVSAQNFSPDIVVDINGTGDFTSLQAAFDAVPSGTPTLIYVKRGLYDQEKLIVPASKTHITLIGESREETIISYDIYNCNDGGDGLCPDNKVEIWAGNSDLIRTAATLTIKANDFRAENITIRNTAGPVGQAQAITLQADRNVFVNCDILAYQDTVYFWMDETSRAYFENSVIEGRTDYIYGRGIGFFNECEIRSYGGAWITAPSSTINQDYGFVFYKCDLTVNSNSPRPGDDGALIRLGRPWHEYPKVAWLYCDFPSQIHPEGWGDKWNMDYADTSPELHLYEWMNTGPGADMSRRADWVGLRAMANQEEADKYEATIVLKGSDNWDPTAIVPTVTVYDWDGGASSNGWLEAENWNPDGTPAASEAANVDNATIDANGGSFPADLNLVNNAIIDISADSDATLLTLNNATLSTSVTAFLSGTIKTKGDITLMSTGDLDLTAALIGVHQFTKTGAGQVQFSHMNSGFAGEVVVMEGELLANVEQAIGVSPKISVKDQGQLTIVKGNAINVSTALSTEGNAKLNLNEDITISEWYVDGTIQNVGQYDATTHPSTITGPGQIIIGRPSVFMFIGGENGNWDNPAHYSPALLPEANEQVIVDGLTIEAQSQPFAADMFVQNGGSIRLRRQDSKCLGPVTMYQRTSISYATSGSGFYLDAPVVLEGDISLFMNSANTSGSVMDLPGTFSGESKIFVRNTRNVANSATVKLGGDNSGFTGTWDLSIAASNAAGYSAIDGVVENAFGNAKIVLAENNQAIFNHQNCAGRQLNMDISGNASAVLNVDVKVGGFMLNGETLGEGIYNATTHAGLLTGAGSITVDASLGVQDLIYYDYGVLRVHGVLESLEVFNVAGQRLYQTQTEQRINLDRFDSGIYIIRYTVDGKSGVSKIYKR